MKKQLRKFIALSAFLMFGLASCNNNNNNNNNPSGGDPSPIENVSVSSISINKDNYDLKIGKSVKLNATVLPTNAYNLTVTFASSDTSIAVVDDTGLVTGVSVGQCTITAKTVDGGYEASCLLNVVSLDSEIDSEDNEHVTEVDVSEDDNDITKDFKLTDGTNEITPVNGIYTISVSEDSSFTASGKLDEGQIVVDSDDVDVEIVLKNVSITCSTNSPIYCSNAGEVEIKSDKNTTNFIIDKRPLIDEENEVEGQGKGAIYAECDLKFTGKGTTYISSTYYNGIHTKDDFSIKNSSLKIVAVNNGIKANDSFEMESGAIDIECGWDGIKTESTDLNKDGTKQRGNVDIIDGSLIINSMADGVTASNILTIGSEETTPSIDIKTNKFSSYSGESVTYVDTETFYIKVPSQYASNSYSYALYFNDIDEWANATLSSTSQQQGGFGMPGRMDNSSYYTVKVPTNVTNYTLYRFLSTQTECSTEIYNACSSTTTFSSYYNGISISQISGKVIKTSNYYYQESGMGGMGPGGMGPGNEGNSDKSDYSSKGLKAENEIYIYSGNISISAYDDAIHTNKDQVFESGLIPTGDIYISGGDINISCTDDGIHAERKLNISGGNLNVNTAYEAYEGNTIDITGGNIKGYATDDAMNAGVGELTPYIKITGGYIDLEVSLSGDTDCIDSNGSYIQTGGTVIARGPNSMNASAIDTDGYVKLSGGTLIVLGSIEKTPQTTNMTRTTNLNGHSKGDHIITINGTAYSYTNKTSYGKTIVYSDAGSATLTK